MAKTYIRVYIHLVWATKHRSATLTSEHEQTILDSFAQTCEALGLLLLAANGAWDHVHLLVGWTPGVCMDDAVRELKSRAWHACFEHAQHHPLCGTPPRWQRGYSAHSLDNARIPQVARYIRRQKDHHQRPASLLADLEEYGDDD